MLSIGVPAFKHKKEFPVTADLVQQNNLYSGKHAHWPEIEENYNFLLQEFLHFTKGETLGEPFNLKEWQTLVQQKVKEMKEEKGPALLILLRRLVKESDSDQKGKSKLNVHRYLSVCLKKMLDMYDSLYGKLNQIRSQVNKLHEMHEEMLRKAFTKAIESLQHDYQQSHQEYMRLKSQWTFQRQDSLVKLEGQYQHFSSDLLNWINDFFCHQKAVLSLTSREIIPKEFYHVLETILVRTEQLKLQLDEKENRKGTSLIGSHSSYISTLEKLSECWIKIEKKYHTIIQHETKQLDGHCHAISLRLRKDKFEVDQLEQSVRCIEEELDHLHTISSESKSEIIEVRVKSTISLKNQLEAFKPKLAAARYRLGETLKDLAEMEEKRKLSHTPLPDMNILKNLKKNETALLENQAALQANGQKYLEEFTVEWKHRQTLQFETFHRQLALTASSAHQDRRTCEWQQWAIFEQSIKSNEQEIELLKKSLTQYREECNFLFSQTSDFDDLIAKLDEGFPSLIKDYTESRVHTQGMHLHRLIQFFQECHNQLKSLKK